MKTDTIEAVCKLMDITPRHWSRLQKDGIAHKAKDGTPDFPRSNVGYIRFLRDGTNADVKDLRRRKLLAETLHAEAKRAEQVGELVPAAMYAANYEECVTKICAGVSRLAGLSDEQKQAVIEVMKAVELEPLPSEEMEAVAND